MVRPVGEPSFIGVDVGTSSVKAVFAGADGTIIDRFAAAHSMSRPAATAAEQDPRDWMRLVDAALDQFASYSRARSVRAIGVTSQVNTHVFCGADLSPLTPALTWQDTRPAAQARILDAGLSPETKAAALGAPIPIDASHALARMAWMDANFPDIWRRSEHVLLPKDYVVARMTGVIAADPISSVGLVGLDHTYAAQVLNLVPRAAELLPPLLDPLSVTGVVASDRPFAGVPVATGTMDAWAGMFGLGVASEGQAMYLSGTSEVLGLISNHGAGAPGIITFPSWRGIGLHAGPTQSGGASLAWVARLLGLDVGALDPLAEGAPITRDSPLFLPHLEGERAPLWDPSSRGAFAGLSGVSGPAELVASVMEGVAYSARMALDAIEVSGGQAIASLRHGGGGARSDIWCQIRANALGRRLERMAAPEVGAMGAMVLAGVASGHLPSLEQAADDLVVYDRSFEPAPSASDLHEERYAAFRALYDQLAPVNAALAGTS